MTAEQAAEGTRAGVAGFQLRIDNAIARHQRLNALFDFQRRKIFAQTQAGFGTKTAAQGETADAEMRGDFGGRGVLVQMAADIGADFGQAHWFHHSACCFEGKSQYKSMAGSRQTGAAGGFQTGISVLTHHILRLTGGKLIHIIHQHIKQPILRFFAGPRHVRGHD